MGGATLRVYFVHSRVRSFPGSPPLQRTLTIRPIVEQASQPGVRCAQVARELGIRDTPLTRWKREAQSQGAHDFKPCVPPRSPLQPAERMAA